MKIPWWGKIVGVQPRIRLLRSFDERSHSYLGYVLELDGVCGETPGRFFIAIGKAAQAKHSFRVGMEASGMSVPVENPKMETAGFYKTSGIKILAEPQAEKNEGPPFHNLVPDIEVYRSRGHRRLDARTYGKKCSTCMWGCRMPVEMIIDHWNPSQRRYRFETFCYGPKSCSSYRPGPKRKVPGRKGMVHVEEDWIDEEETRHRDD